MNQASQTCNRFRFPETADEVRERVMEIIGLADEDALDLLRSRSREQEVLGILDDATIP